MKRNRTTILLAAALLVIWFFSRFFSGGTAGGTPETQVPADGAGITTGATEGIDVIPYTFRSEKLFNEHYDKHGAEFGNITQEEYLRGAQVLIANPDALTKEDENGDTLYYDEANNEFAVLSNDGYIRTFFKPSAGIDYWNRQ